MISEPMPSNDGPLKMVPGLHFFFTAAAAAVILIATSSFFSLLLPQGKSAAAVRNFNV